MPTKPTELDLMRDIGSVVDTFRPIDRRRAAELVDLSLCALLTLEPLARDRLARWLLAKADADTTVAEEEQAKRREAKADRNTRPPDATDPDPPRWDDPCPYCVADFNYELKLVTHEEGCPNKPAVAELDRDPTLAAGADA